jgi:hypothetical protein
VRSTGRGGFSANIYRTDASPASMTDGWHGPLGTAFTCFTSTPVQILTPEMLTVIHYIAWDYVTHQGPGGGGGVNGGMPAGERGREGEVGVLFGSWDIPRLHAPPGGAVWVPPPGEVLTLRHFTGTKVQILTQTALPGGARLFCSPCHAAQPPAISRFSRV